MSVCAIFNLGTHDVRWRPAGGSEFLDIHSTGDGLETVGHRCLGLYDACQHFFQHFPDGVSDPAASDDVRPYMEVPSDGGALWFPILYAALSRYLKGEPARIVLVVTDDEKYRERPHPGFPQNDDTYFAGRLAALWLRREYPGATVELVKLKDRPHEYESAWDALRKVEALSDDKFREHSLVSACLSPGLPMVNFALARLLSRFVPQAEPKVDLYQIAAPQKSDLLKGELGAASPAKPIPFSLLRLDYFLQMAPALIERFDYAAALALFSSLDGMVRNEMPRCLDLLPRLVRMRSGDVRGAVAGDARLSPEREAWLRARLAAEVFGMHVRRSDWNAAIVCAGDVVSYLSDVVVASQLGLLDAFLENKVLRRIPDSQTGSGEANNWAFCARNEDAGLFEVTLASRLPGAAKDRFSDWAPLRARHGEIRIDRVLNHWRSDTDRWSEEDEIASLRTDLEAIRTERHSVTHVLRPVSDELGSAVLAIGDSTVGECLDKRIQWVGEYLSVNEAADTFSGFDFWNREILGEIGRAFGVVARDRGEAL